MGITTTNTEHRWPDRRISFVIDDNDFPLNSMQRQSVQNGIDLWNPIVRATGAAYEQG